MLARGHDLFADLEMDVIRRAVVHHVDLLVGEQRIHAAEGFRNMELRGLCFRQLVARLAQRVHLDKPQPPRRFNVRRPDEPRPNDASLDRFHS